MSRPDSSASPALQGCLETCRRCEALVNLVVSDDSKLEVFNAVGPHLRHCLDHFASLIRGLESGVVDYDDRGRRASLERDPAKLLAALHQVTAELARLEGRTTGRSLDVVQLAAPGRGVHRAASTLERELVFLSSHTVHHLALAIEIAASLGLQLPRELGMAFSTAAYLEKNQAASA